MSALESIVFQCLYQRLHVEYCDEQSTLHAFITRLPTLLFVRTHMQMELHCKKIVKPYFSMVIVYYYAKLRKCIYDGDKCVVILFPITRENVTRVEHEKNFCILSVLSVYMSI